MIVQALRQIQEHHGYLPEEELIFLAQRANVPLYRVQEVASFFPHYRRELPPDVTVHLCRDMACHLRGSAELLQAGRRCAEALDGKAVSVEPVSCLGRCDRAPAALISRHGHSPEQQLHEALYVGLNSDGGRRDLCRLIETLAAGGPAPDADTDLANSKDGALWAVDVYDRRHATESNAPISADSGVAPAPPAALQAEPPTAEVPTTARSIGIVPDHPYAAVRKFVAELATDETKARADLIATLKASGLVGMGGAGGRTWKKWQEVREAKGDEKYVVCNGDESEPGTFKDRELLLRAPHLVVEGVILCGLYLGASRGYIYIRHEYREQIDAVNEAIRRGRRDLPAKARDFPVEVFVSPGGYICGEQTALLEAMEDRRAQPRNAPPEIQTNGLFDKPTVVNNVETFAWTPAIVLRGGQWWSDAARAGYKGRRFFSISGDLRNPGVFEVPVGLTFRELMNDLAGGLRPGYTLRAIAPSGPSGGFIPAKLPAAPLRAAIEKSLPGMQKREPAEAARLERFLTKLPPEKPELDVLDLELDGSLFRGLGFMLGAGIVVFGDHPDRPFEMLDHTINLLRFYEKESCGKCVPCRLGAQKLLQIAVDAKDNPRLLTDAKAEVAELARVMEITSICGLGRAAPNGIISLMQRFGSNS